MSNATTDPLRERLDQHEGDSVPYWDPEVGDVVIGTIVAIEVRTAPHSGRTPVLTIQDEISGGLIDVWALHTVLRSELKKLRPKKGDRIGIKRLPDADKGYRRFVVKTDGEPATVDWDSVSATGEDMADPDLTPETAKLIGHDEGTTPEADDLPF